MQRAGPLDVCRQPGIRILPDGMSGTTHHQRHAPSKTTLRQQRSRRPEAKLRAGIRNSRADETCRRRKATYELMTRTRQRPAQSPNRMQTHVDTHLLWSRATPLSSTTRRLTVGEVADKWSTGEERIRRALCSYPQPVWANPITDSIAVKNNLTPRQIFPRVLHTSCTASSRHFASSVCHFMLACPRLGLGSGCR